MRRMSRRIIAYVLLLCMLLSCAVDANASEAGVLQTQTFYNPYYTDQTNLLDDSLFLESGAEELQAATNTDEEIQTIIRTAMINRESSVSFTAHLDSTSTWNAQCQTWFAMALEECDDSRGGDALRWVYSNWRASGSYSAAQEGGYTFKTTLTLSYYTTAAQEAELDAAIESKLSSFGFTEDTDTYTKIKTIYDFITSHVSYDYTSTDNLKYTAYAAMINKTSVCQGYALLFYRMCKEEGIGVRFVSGTGNSGAHGWNIVEIGSKYYFADATWDAGKTTYSYFLKGSGTKNFPSHTLDSEYTTDAFKAAYPISTSNYVYSPGAGTGGDAGTTDGSEGSAGSGEDSEEEETACVHETYQTIVPASLTGNGSINTICALCNTTISTKEVAYPKTISLSATSYTYSGGVRTPSVAVVDANGKTISGSSYTVSYATGRKNVGTYAVTITFKGNYTGSKTLYFKILPKGTSLKSVAAGSKSFTAKWSKQATQTTGYQIQYSTSSKFSGSKYCVVSKTGTVSKKIASLKSKKKYYVRIRTYKKVGSSYYYSGWSSAKAVKTK